MEWTVEMADLVAWYVISSINDHDKIVNAASLSTLKFFKQVYANYIFFILWRKFKTA